MWRVNYGSWVLGTGIEIWILVDGRDAVIVYLSWVFRLRKILGLPAGMISWSMSLLETIG